jgi:peptidyl-prolyl cis-trans isomerase D
MMMQGIRNAGRTWLGKLLVAVLFTLLIGSFAIWGIGDIFRGGGRNTVATVGKTEIDIETVRTAYQNEIQRLSRQFRQNITPAQARIFGVDQQVLSRLVTEAALNTDAAARNLTISDAAVARSIVEDANFRGPSGDFNRAMFNELLRQAGLNEAGYVREQRTAIVRNQLAEAISGLSTAPVAIQEAAHRHRNERRILSYIELPPAAAGDIGAPTEEVLKKFFEERKAAFRAPEHRTAQVLALTPQTLADPSGVAEADAAAHYERIKARFGTPERRTVQQIVFPSQADAAAALARIRAGGDFAEVAKERSVSEADLTLGTFTRAEMLDQVVAGAAFGLAANAVSEPVPGAFGFALLRVTAIEPERVRPLAEVAGEVRSDLATSRAVQALSEVHDKIEDMRAGARPLAEIAKELKLTMAALGPIDRTRQLAAGGPAPGIPALEQVVEAMFRADVGTDNEAVRTRDNGYVWYDVTAIDQARERSFDEVRDAVASQWRQDEVATRLQAKAREVTDRLGKGEALEAIAASLGIAASISPELTRTSSIPEFPANVLTVAFGTAVNAAASADLGSLRGRMVFKVQSATVAPFLRTTNEAETVSQQLGVAIGDDLLSQYVSGLQTRLGVRINQTTFRNATGGGES